MFHFGRVLLLLLVWVTALAACSKPDQPLALAKNVTVIDWIKPSGSDMTPIMALARAQNKPLFIYWGAVWCPPCNQVKATVFSRPDFLARSQSFIPVYVDGDAPGAQKLGQDFKVRGYPTMILLSPNGTELTRLPGEIDARKYLDALDLALQSPLSVKASLNLVSEGKADQVNAKAWRQLAYYAWDQDQAQLVPADKLVPTLAELVRTCPPGEIEAATRLFLKMLAVAALESAPIKDLSVHTRRLEALLADHQLAQIGADVLINYGEDLIKVLTPEAGLQRTAMVESLVRVLDDLSQDVRLSMADRLGAVGTKLALVKSIGDTQASEVRVQVQQVVEAMDRQVSDAYERQALIPGAADLLAKAGFDQQAMDLLQAELPNAIAPYYHMSVLSSLAKTRGDVSAAVNWAEKAWLASQGPATRLQWGAAYVSRMIDLTPQDAPRIAKAALAVLAEVEPAAETFYHRNRRVLERMGKRLTTWGHQKNQLTTLRQIVRALDGVCAKVPTAEPRKVCQGVFESDQVNKPV